MKLPTKIPPGIAPPATEEDLRWMRMAIAESACTAASNDVPVGAVVVRAGIVLGRGANRREADGDPTAHAEILAIRNAAGTIGLWRLTDCTLYVTQEPCPMCAGAVVNARIDRLVYGCDNPKAGAVRTLHQLVDDPRFNHRATVVRGVLAEECGALLTSFFKRLRAK